MIELQTPLQEKDLLDLHAGDHVLLSGTIYTARDAAHKKFFNLIEGGLDLPLPTKGSVIFYVGPSPAKPGKPIGAAGPTTSYRMDSYSVKLLESGLKGMIGKGARSQEVIDGMVRHKAVYFGATGGAAALLAKSVIKADVIAFPELGPEAVRKLVVEKMPLIVINDCHGGDLYKKGIEKYRID